MATTLIALLTLSISPLLASDTTDSTTGNKYHVYTFNKPGTFQSLEAFVQDTYGADLESATLTTVSIDGKPGVTYWTEGAGVRNFHLVMEEGSALVLMTTAELTHHRGRRNRRLRRPSPSNIAPIDVCVYRSGLQPMRNRRERQQLREVRPLPGTVATVG